MCRCRRSSTRARSTSPTPSRSRRRWPSNRPRTALALGLGALLLAAGGPAGAKTKRTVPYPYEQVWPTAVRFLRIDEHHEILEKDGDAGYVIFAVDEDGKRFRGTLELVEVVDDGRPAVRLTVDIEDRPAYMEAGILDRLLIKLRTERGPPARPPAKPAPKPAEPEPPADD